MYSNAYIMYKNYMYNRALCTYVRTRAHTKSQPTHRNHGLATGVFTPLPNAHSNRIRSISDEGFGDKHICSISFLCVCVRVNLTNSLCNISARQGRFDSAVFHSVAIPAAKQRNRSGTLLAFCIGKQTTVSTQ